MRSVVDLPQPEGPSSTMNSPCAISRSTESTARRIGTAGSRFDSPRSETVAIT